MEMDATPQDMSADAPSSGGMGKKIFGIVIILVIIAGAIWYWTSRPATDSPEAVAAEVEKVVAEVSRVMVLPENETPTVGTVTDPSVFAGQAFFEGIQEGDKILVYPNRGMVVLYSASLKKILGVAPLTLNPVPDTASQDVADDSEE